MSCFNECCADLNLSLSPYDVLRLRHTLGVSSKVFFSEYVDVGRMPGNGFPVVMLKMRNDERRSCPFVRDEGCSVYGDRPGCCRVYPLGRGASIGEDDEIQEQYILVREGHCRGLGHEKTWSVGAFLENQGMDSYIENDDRYMRLLNRVNRAGIAVRENQFPHVFVATYRPDALERFSSMVHPSESIVVSNDDPLEYETEMYHRGLEWLSSRLNLDALK